MFVADQCSQLQVYFTKPWRQLLEMSFRNFMTEAFQKLPLPAVLRFDTDRRIRQVSRSILKETISRLSPKIAQLR